MEGFIACNIPIDDRLSCYAKFGDWLPWGCWIGIAGAVIFGGPPAHLFESFISFWRLAAASPLDPPPGS